jgi:hypothetical protein
LDKVFKARLGKEGTLRKEDIRIAAPTAGETSTWFKSGILPILF